MCCYLIKCRHSSLVTLFQETIFILCKLTRHVYKDQYVYKDMYAYKDRAAYMDRTAYNPWIGSVGHLKICVYSGMIVQINHEPLIAPKVTPVTYVDWKVVRTDQEACGTRTESI